MGFFIISQGAPVEELASQELRNYPKISRYRPRKRQGGENSARQPAEVMRKPNKATPIRQLLIFQ